ncbi:MAG: metal-dependent hydrolase [Pseudomonadales bacterium]|nr:metal-dependent hydrolase [Pseudomonadales bacterium]
MGSYQSIKAEQNRAQNGHVQSPVKVRPRHMDFNFPEEIPKYWIDDNPYITHLLNALSAVFPEGERFFIDSVRHYQDQIKDESLLKDIRGFIGQEAHHSKHHQLFNDLVEKKGTPMSAIDKFTRESLKQARKNFSPEHQLAITIALEHFTAVLANQALRDETLYEGMLPEFKNLIRWHAIEETEHKAVAYDVYQEVSGNVGIRRRVMVETTMSFIGDILGFQIYFLIKDGFPIRPIKFLKYLNFLFGTKGFLFRIIPEYLDYYKADFHPWQHDNHELVENWKTRYAHVSENLMKA